jgi:hypothetical protein
MEVIDELMQANIGIHAEILGGREVTAGMHEDVLRWLGPNLRPGMRTVETGCGLSTAVFAAAGTHHTCVSPFADEHRRIASWCAEHGISTESVRFVEGRSDVVLPAMDAHELDLVLIDGSHAFPHAFIDFWYLALRLKPRGLLLVDDLQLWTGGTLSDFLREQPEWELVDDFPPRAAVFRLTGQIEILGAWSRQPFVVARSVDLGVSGARGYLELLRHRRFRWMLVRAREGLARRIR